MSKNTGWLFFNTFTQDSSVGSTPWTEGTISGSFSPAVSLADANMNADNDYKAGFYTTGLASAIQLYYMRCTNIANLNTILPQGCEILGLYAYMRRGFGYVAGPAGGHGTDYSVKLVKNNVVTGTEHAAAPPGTAVYNGYGIDTTLWAGGYHYWGGSTDLWGGLTRDDIDNNFGLAISPGTSDAVNESCIFIKSVAIKIYYNDRGLLLDT